jgi:hypothetical protein
MDGTDDPQGIRWDCLPLSRAPDRRYAAPEARHTVKLFRRQLLRKRVAAGRLGARPKEE